MNPLQCDSCSCGKVSNISEWESRSCTRNPLNVVLLYCLRFENSHYGSRFIIYADEPQVLLLHICVVGDTY